jgi:pimeloyl-ACP methyl ester carboxylesterase
MARSPRLTLALVPVLSFLFLSTATAHAGVVQAPATAASGNFAGLVDIGGGRHLYLECRGTGSPTVILEAGYRSPALVWTEDLAQPDAPRTMVFPGVATFTHVCAYERPGAAALLDGGLVTSRSDAVAQPRDARDVVADLHTLLHTTGVPGPYVLAGHSLGGLFVRLYAATYPDEVAGLVLVDAWSEGLETLLTPQQWNAYVQLNSAVPPELAGYSALETLDFAAVSGEMRQAKAATPLGAMPLAVLAHGQPFGLPEQELGFSPDALETAWSAAQRGLATLEPDARYFVAGDSAHYIQIDQPELVTEAIRQVVAGVRHPDTWSDLSSCCSAASDNR